MTPDDPRDRRPAEPRRGRDPGSPGRPRDSRRGRGQDSGGDPGQDAPVELPIDGHLDLHPFRAKDVASVVNEYLDACRARGILQVRIVHGKGIGALRETVHRTLELRKDVVRFRLDSETASGWGATLVDLEGE